MQQATLCFLVKKNKGERELLLAMKKRGFGQGKWNGIGGKLDLKRDKDIFETAIRETKEEIGVEVKDVEKIAVLNFHFPHQGEWDQDVHVFLAREWEGEPEESEEMKPKWFKISEIPFNEMWSDDEIWLPEVLSGKKLKASFTFSESEAVASHKVEIVKRLD